MIASDARDARSNSLPGAENTAGLATRIIPLRDATTLRVGFEATAGGLGTWWLQAFDAGGEPFSAAFTPGLEQVPTGSDLVSIALPGRRLAVAWTDSGARPEPIPPRICVRAFDLFGKPLGAEVVLDAAWQFAVSRPALAATSSPGFMLAWVGCDADGVARLCVQKFDRQGQRAGEMCCLAGRPVLGHCDITLTVMSGGGFAATWRDAGEACGPGGAQAFRTQLIDPQGASVGDDFLCTFRG